MRSNVLAAAIRHLRQRAGMAPVASCVDSELVTRYVQHAEEAAFEEIVRRHGPLVWALCRSALQTADAEDAFQATFAVLARRAAHIRKRASLACWLSGVARRVIRQARRQAFLRRAITTLVDVGGDTDATPDRLAWREVLDEELQRLPEKYRLPILLCYYQGLTNDEAASRLGWPRGTVCGRLARAREMLRGRLARRGITLGVGTLAACALPLPSEVLGKAIGQCCGSLAGGNLGHTVTGAAFQLATEVIQTMWAEKVKSWTIGAISVVLLGGAAGWVLGPANSQEVKERPPVGAAAKVQPDLPQPAPAAPPFVFEFEGNRLNPKALERSKHEIGHPADSELQKLTRKRYSFAWSELLSRLQAFTAGTTLGPVDTLLGSITQRLLPAELALSDRPEDQIAAYEKALDILKWVEAVEEVRYKAGRVAAQELEQIVVERLGVEMILLKMKQRVMPSK